MAGSHKTIVFNLNTPDPVLEAPVGDEVTLRCHLSPETSAVSMEIRWFKERDCIYLYKDDVVRVGRGYEGRVRVNPQELQRGDVSLTLEKRKKGDGGVYTCEVISGEHEKEGRVGRVGLKTSKKKAAGIGVGSGVGSAVVTGAAGAAIGGPIGLLIGAAIGVGIGVRMGLRGRSSVESKVKKDLTAKDKKKMKKSVQSLAKKKV